MKKITYSSGESVPSVIVIWDDMNNQQPGYKRAFWSSSPYGTTGSTVIGYCSPGGSHKTIKAVAREISRLHPGEKIYRYGKEVKF